MKKSFITLLLAVLSLSLLSACGVFQEVEAPSATLEAIPLETQSAGVATSAPAEATEAPAEPTQRRPQVPADSGQGRSPALMAEMSARV